MKFYKKHFCFIVCHFLYAFVQISLMLQKLKKFKNDRGIGWSFKIPLNFNADLPSEEGDHYSTLFLGYDGLKVRVVGLTTQALEEMNPSCAWVTC